MDDDNSISSGVNLIAYIRAEMGLGTAARGLALAMESANIPFNVINFEYQNLSLHRDTDWRHKEVFSSSHDFTILAVNPDNIFNATDLVQKQFVRDRYTIGYWFWELPEFPDAWLPCFSLVDEVWTSSRFVQDSISLKSPVPVWRVPMAIRLGPADKFSRADFSLPPRRFLFLSLTDTHSSLKRKNPLGVVRAFKTAFSGDDRSVGLVLKINNTTTVYADPEDMAMIREEIGGYRNIYLLDRSMTRAEIDSLLNVCDCFISLHRSEGFGLGPAEAMSLAKPVILTNWSGNRDYMTPDNSLGIDFELIPIGKQYGPYQPNQHWADPDLDQAAFWMKRLAKDAELATRIGMRGQETIRNDFSPEAVGKLILKRLNHLQHAAPFTRITSRLNTQLKLDVESLQRRVDILKRASITAYPNPIQVDGSVVGETTLSYAFLEGEPVEIHLGSPDGPLFARPDKSGKSDTGNWVTDGMVFFLQDVSNGNPLTREHTLATVTVRLSLQQALAGQLTEREAELKRVTSSLNWRLFVDIIKHTYILPVYDWMRRVRGILKPPVSAPSSGTLYKTWVLSCEEARCDAARAAENIERFDYQPTISIIMPVYNPSKANLTMALDSVLNQYYPLWELCICDDASTARDVRKVLQAYAARDRRIKVVFSEKNGGIAAASSRALELVTGEFIGLLDHDDEITPDALYEVVRALQEVDADLIYSDEDKLDIDGSRCDPYFKPAWSPDLLFSFNYISHFGVYRKSLIDEIGSFREGFDGSQDYDLVLRFTEKTDKVVHIPKILYHWRKVSGSAATSVLAKPYAYEAATKALAETLRRREIEGVVTMENPSGIYRVKRTVVSPEKVSIIIPTRDRLDLLQKCIGSIETMTDYENYEILIINNASREPSTIDYLNQTRHRVIYDGDSFSFSRLNNRAAKEVDSEYLLFLNNDTEVLSSEWLSALIEHAQRPEVGAVGAKLLYPDNRIQHAGIVLGIRDVAGHSHKYMNGCDDSGSFEFTSVIRNYSAVTGACLMMRRKLFQEIGGFDEENLSIAFNDVDLCLRLRRAGYLIVYTPYALLYHHESASRGFDLNPAEVSYMMTKWRKELPNDPYYSPSLTLETEDFAIDFSKPESFCRSGAEQELSSQLPDISGELHVGRKIAMEEDNFCAVGIEFGKSPHPRKGTVIVHVRHADEPASDLRTAAVDASLIQDNQYRVFSFNPISDSSLNSYYIFVEYSKHKPGKALHNVKRSNNGALGSHRKDPLLLGSMLLRVFFQKQFRCA